MASRSVGLVDWKAFARNRRSTELTTKPIFGHGLEHAAELLLRSVADGAPESVEMARELVAVVLSATLVARAVALDELLRRQSPLALVRAVELAEGVLRDAGADARERQGKRV